MLDYRLVVDWEGSILVDGERWFETDLGYAVGLSEAWVSTTNLELVPCLTQDSGWASLFIKSAYAHVGHTHDASQITPDLLEELVGGEGVDLGLAPGGGGPYCELYQIMGPATEEELVARIVGWYIPPGGERVDFVAESHVGTSALADVGEGAWAELDEADAEVAWVRFPARALDGLALETLSELDLAFSFAWALGYGGEVRWWGE
ncbi:MAG: hypothetical protein H6741_28340 [Alphaproteobacteria bacterium]|nr:hypothetical protein [Alphaproteobacteria bacterium]